MKVKLPCRRWLILASLAAVAIGWLLFGPWGRQFTREQYEHVRLGMSLDEVEQVLGLPPGHYDPITRGWSRDGVADEVNPEGIESRQLRAMWFGDGGHICVLIYKDKVRAKYYSRPVSPMGVKIREWLNWLRWQIVGPRSWDHGLAPTR
jgi:hypothetical protein